MITDLQTRKIASEWHGGQSSPLYALTSSGAITEDCAEEIAYNLETEYGVTEGLPELLDYVRAHGVRGPEEGWSDLNW